MPEHGDVGGGIAAVEQALEALRHAVARGRARPLLGEVAKGAQRVQKLLHAPRIAGKKPGRPRSRQASAIGKHGRCQIQLRHGAEHAGRLVAGALRLELFQQGGVRRRSGRGSRAACGNRPCRRVLLWTARNFGGHGCRPAPDAEAFPHEAEVQRRRKFRTPALQLLVFPGLEMQDHPLPDAFQKNGIACGSFAEARMLLVEQF